ncbi:hypothetical protein BJ875DRAFT_446379, partial [Amylocarpus encephaloides]
VKSAGVNQKGGLARHLPRNDLPPLPSLAAKFSNKRARRAVGYITQKDAVTELVELSQPSFVYHIETGVSYKKQANEDAREDSHGTYSAGKAVGKNYGSAKQAKLVAVQIWDVKVSELNNAVKLIMRDIEARPERKKKSVATMSLWILPGLEGNAEDLYWDLIKGLLDMDVPMFVSAGNETEDPSRRDVDTYPALFAAPDYPLIVVGSTDHGGARSSFSQDTFPFDASDGKLVMNMRTYLQSNAASWARTPDIPVIWNGVNEKDTPKIDASGPVSPSTSPPVPPPEKKCHGVATQKYVSFDGLKDRIQKEFCPDAVKQGGPDKDSGSIVRRYNEGTPEQISIAIDVLTGGVPPNEGDCEKHFLELIDGCDGNDPKNSLNYKAGGVFTGGKSIYRMDPQSPRQPASNGKKGGCDSSYKLLYNEYTVWGQGWDSADHGDALKNEVKGCALLPDTWSFSYGNGDDGREWTAKFRTGVFQKKCTGHAGKSASGIDNFGCGGSGQGK